MVISHNEIYCVIFEIKKKHLKKKMFLGKREIKVQKAKEFHAGIVTYFELPLHPIPVLTEKIEFPNPI